MPAAPARARAPKLDAVSAAAIDMAARALIEGAEPSHVGDQVGVQASGERLVTHRFEATMDGYRGWYWLVVLARAPRAKQPTVCETALVPGEEALLAPVWEPWAERLRPEDVGADDVLPYRESDPRLEQGWEKTSDEEADRVAQWELGLGRARVLSPQGRAAAAARWLDGEFGPRELSKRRRKGTVTAHCSSCGFLSLLDGPLRQEFGICTNEWSPADGRVVSLRYGCGAHSETDAESAQHHSELPPNVVDDTEVEFIDRFAQTSIIDEELLQKEREKAAARKAADSHKDPAEPQDNAAGGDELREHASEQDEDAST